MDLSRGVYYRGVNLNGATQADNGLLDGYKIERITEPGVRGIGYDEKRAAGDGYDAADVYLGKLQWVIRGTVYGSTRAKTFDNFQALKAVLAPTLAYAADNDEYGYLPLTFEEPTELTADFSTGYRALKVNVRPVAGPSRDIDNDRSGGEKGFAIPYTAMFEARDPRIYVQDQVEVALTGATSGSGTFANRGDYPAPLRIYMVCDANAPQTLHFVGLDSDITITVPDNDLPMSILYDAGLGILRKTIGGQTTVDMSLLSSVGEITHPMVPAAGGAYTWTLSVEVLLAGSQFEYNEAYA